MRKKYATTSTTSLMRQAGERADWNVAKAVSILSYWSYDHPNAKSAIRVIKQCAAGAPKFTIDEKRSGLVVGVAA